jgi:hypothetical protein
MQSELNGGAGDGDGNGGGDGKCGCTRRSKKEGSVGSGVHVAGEYLKGAI